MSTTFTYNNTHGPLQYATAVPVPLNHEAKKKRNNSENTLSFTSLTNHNMVCKPISETDINRLKSQGFTSGLAEALSQNNLAFPLRVWVIDNSGSMVRITILCEISLNISYIIYHITEFETHSYIILFFSSMFHIVYSTFKL